MTMSKRWAFDNSDPGFLKTEGNIDDLLIHVSTQVAVARKKLIENGVTEEQVAKYIEMGVYEEVKYD